jgi:hypothetical protein
MIFFLLDLFSEGHNRHGFTTEELMVLKEMYTRNGGRPTVLERESLMARFGLSKETVFGWFQNRSFREKRTIEVKKKH